MTFTIRVGEVRGAEFKVTWVASKTQEARTGAYDLEGLTLRNKIGADAN